MVYFFRSGKLVRSTCVWWSFACTDSTGKSSKAFLVISNVQAVIEDIHFAVVTHRRTEVKAMQELTADVHNNGIEPIRMVYATIATLNEFGSKQTWSDCDIYAAWDSEPRNTAG